MQSMLDRTYSIGDVGYILGARLNDTDGIVPLMDAGRMRSQQEAQRRGATVCLMETLVIWTKEAREQYGENHRDGADDDEQPAAYETRELGFVTAARGEWDTRYSTLSPRNINQGLETCGLNLSSILPGPDNAAKRAFLYEFCYPMITTGRGYLEMLADFASVIGRPAIKQAQVLSSQEILAKAQAFGIEVIELDYSRHEKVGLVPSNSKIVLNMYDAVKRAYISLG